MSSYFIATSSSAASSPIASVSPGMPIASVRPESRMSVEPSSFDAASTSQVRLKNAYLGGLMEEQWRDPSKQEEDSEDSDNPAAGTWYYQGELVAQNNKVWGKPLAYGASSSVDQGSQKSNEATWNHHLQISPNTSHYLEAVFSMVRKIYGRQPGDPVKYLHVSLSICTVFLNTTLRAAVHLGKDYDTNLRIVQNFLWRTTGQLFRETEKLINSQT